MDSSKAGGHPLNNYNLYSSIQLKCALSALDQLKNSIDHASALTSSTINICDFGCSECHNSKTIFTELITYFRTKSNQSVYLTHTDLPDNNWQQVLATLSTNSYNTLSNVYYSILGRSFFHQLFPSSSVHLGFSSCAFHYLSVKLSPPDHIIPSCTKDPEFREIAREQATKDFLEILSHRWNELVIGGRLILIQVTQRPDTFLFSDILTSVLDSMVTSGTITQEEKKDFSISLYRMTTEEIENCLNLARPMFNILASDSLKCIDDSYEEFLVTGNIEKYKNNATNWIRVIYEFPLSRSLKREQQEKDQIINQYFDNVSCVIERELPELSVSYQRIVLEKKLNNL